MEKPKLEVISFKQGMYIYVEGKAADSFFIMMSGKIRVFKEVETQEEEGTTILKPGDTLGVVAAMSRHNHLETAEALGDCTLIKVKVAQFAGLIEHNASVALKIITKFSRQVRFLNDALAKALHEEPQKENSSAIFHAAEFYERKGRLYDAYAVYKTYVNRFPVGQLTSKARLKLEKLAVYSNNIVTIPGTNREYEKDQFIFVDGEMGNELFVLVKGSVRITKVVGAAEMIFAVLKPGDIFGEMAILESQPRSANAIAAEHSICMVMDMKTLIDSASTQTKIIEKLTTVLAERIWFSYKQLSNANIDDPIGRIYDGLAMYLEKAFIDEFEKHSFIFDFTPADFLKMTKTTDNEAAMSELIRNKILVVRGNKLATDNTMEIFKQRMYYRNAQARQKKLSKKPDASSAQ